jgi:threonine/homoserine/homoserine lactone efflux protein
VTEPGLFAAFLVTAAATVISPGPDTLVILRCGVAGGWRPGVAAVAGVQSGLVLHTAAAAVGLSVVLAGLPFALPVIAAVGALYLAWLGVEGVRAGLLDPAALAAGPRVSPWRAAREAMFTNLLNPKVLIIYAALMPNFVVVEAGPLWRQFTVMGIALIAINTAWQLGLALAADRIRRWLGNPRVQRAVSWSTGGILLLFAVGLLADHVVAALA